MCSRNPVLRERFTDPHRYPAGLPGGYMTVRGTALKAGLLLLLVVAVAVVAWLRFGQMPPHAFLPNLLCGLVAGFVLALATCLKPEWARWTAPPYAVTEGVVLGGLSALIDAGYPGVAFQAVCLTFGTLFVMLAVYATGWVRVTQSFKAGVIGATGGILVVYLASLVLRCCGFPVPLIHEGGWIGIAFSLFVVAVAALNLVLDFDFIQASAASSQPRKMEWFGAFGLLVTLVWLYTEILHLLNKLSSHE